MQTRYFDLRDTKGPQKEIEDKIAAAAKTQLNLDIDKKKLNLQEPIRMVGMVIVPYKVHPKVTAELKVKVVEA